METNEMNVQQPPVQNKKLMFCKACGAQMAKSAKRCPSCGGKNGRRKIVNFFKGIAIVAIIIISTIVINIVTAPKAIELGDVVEKRNLSIQLKNVQYDNTIFVKGDTLADDFLTPIQRENRKNGGRLFWSYTKDSAPFVITIAAENSGKKDVTLSPDSFVINYDDNRYYVDLCYAKIEDNSISGFEWTEFDEVKLEKVTSGAVEVKLLIWLPLEVFEDSKSINLEFDGAVYKIR